MVPQALNMTLGTPHMVQQALIMALGTPHMVTQARYMAPEPPDIVPHAKKYLQDPSYSTKSSEYSSRNFFEAFVKFHQNRLENRQFTAMKFKNRYFWGPMTSPKAPSRQE